MKDDYDFLLLRREAEAARKRVSGYSPQKKAELLKKARAAVKKSKRKS